MKIKVNKKVTIEETLEIKFPIYYGYGGNSDAGNMSWDSVGRVLSDGSTIFLTETTEDDEVTWKINTSVSDIAEEFDFFLRNPSTAAEFNEAVAKFKSYLSSVDFS